MIKELVKKKSNRSTITLEGKRGHFIGKFKPNQKVYVFNVAKSFALSDLKKVKFKFNKKDNTLECWTEPYRYGKMVFIVNWVESDKFRRSNV